MLATVPLASPHPGLTGPRSIAILVCLAVCAVAWIVWLQAGRQLPAHGDGAGGDGGGGRRRWPGCPRSAPPSRSAAWSPRRRASGSSTEASLTITAATVAAFLIAGFTVGAPAETLAGYPAALIGLWAFGLTRRAYLLRAEEAEEAPGAGPPGARGREPGGRAGRAGADRPGDPRRARALPRRRLGQPAGGRGPARRAAGRLARVRGGEGDGVHRTGGGLHPRRHDRDAGGRSWRCARARTPTADGGCTASSRRRPGWWRSCGR